MQQEYLTILRTLKENIEELTAPIEAGEIEFFGEDSHKVQSGLDLIMGELTMVVLILTDVHSGVSAHELELLNDMRHVVYGYGIPELDSSNYWDLCRKFLRIHPGRRMTIDHLPLTVQLLQIYDQGNGTQYADKARTLFIQFAEAMINVDKDKHPVEGVLLEHFRSVLYGEIGYES